MTTADSVVDLLVTAGRLTRLAGTIGGDDLPRAVLRALSELDEHGSMRISEFARIDRCSQPAATALIARLVAEGYASRHKDPEDSRAVLVELTEAGRDRLRRARRHYGEILASRLTDIEPERLRRMESELSDLLDALKNTGPRPEQDVEHDASKR
ncbi:MarR family winged helix-turn-helix transcriptional regulator [Nocardia takedensis]|uniref:MarR family winged helix-turn-helix transcriptional regulator n=1 Tax=Nocardia takedensis TaxID=259390 RepID=UPI0002EE40B6|nr:MarR family winged helix-turn-helix transcriptional regulator [Nocardia takedensis]